MLTLLPLILNSTTFNFILLTIPTRTNLQGNRTLLHKTDILIPRIDTIYKYSERNKINCAGGNYSKEELFK